jgi:drug/metabolite transporter (DMT)-like permease
MSCLVEPEPWVALTLAAALLFAVGNALQKRGVHGRITSSSAWAFLGELPRVVAALLRSPSWMLGLAVTLAAVALETQALAFGDVTAVKPLSRIQALFVLAIGVGVLRERLRRSEWLGVGVMLVGAALLIAEPGEARAHAPGAPLSVAAGLGVAALVAGGLRIAERGRSRVLREHAPALAAGACFGLGDVLMKAATQVVRGRTGGFDVASTGTLASLASTVEFALSLCAMSLAFALQQLAFSRGRVSLVIPLIGVAGTLAVVLLGAALLREPVGPARAAGMATLLAGTLLVAREGAHAAFLPGAPGALGPRRS